MDNKTVVHSYNIILSIKKEQATDTHKSLHGYQGYHVEWKMTDKK